MPKFIDLSGMCFGRLTVIKEVKVENKKGKYWLCSCSCGSENLVKRGDGMVTGKVQSCGCLASEIQSKRMKEQNVLKATHRMTNTKIYRVWVNMKARCYDKGHQHYDLYGGRGITVCEEWLNSFETFYSDMGDKPEKLSISRIDTNLGYSKDNCEWATGFVQSREVRKTSKPTTSKFKGVAWSKSAKKFEGYLNYRGERYYLGLSEDDEYLARLYDQKVLELSGTDDGTNVKLGLLSKIDD